MAENDGFAVKLNVYDLTKGLARSLSMAFLGKQIDGVWHTGIVVYGEEYYFGGTGGIESCSPCGTILGQPDRVVDMGITHVPKDMFIEYLAQQATTSFRPERYNLFEHNCNNFSDEVSHFLTGKAIPSHITSLPADVLNTPLGAMIKPLIDSMNVQPSGGHSVFSSPPASNHQTAISTPINNTQINKRNNTSSDILQKSLVFKAEIDNTLMKGDEIQGNIKSSFSAVELNLWNETLEYLNTSNPSWTLGKNHVNMIGKILCSKPGEIKMILWKTTCLMLQNLMLLKDFLPVLVHSAPQTLGQIISQYKHLTTEYKQCLIKVVINLCSSNLGSDILFGDKRDVILSNNCIEMCCDGLLDDQSDEFLLLSASLSFNISLAQTNDDIEVEISSAVTTRLQQHITQNTASYLLSALINILNRNTQVQSLVAVMGCEWPHLDELSEEINKLNSTVKSLCKS